MSGHVWWSSTCRWRYTSPSLTPPPSVEPPALLLLVVVAGRGLVLDQLGGDLERLLAAAQRELVLDEGDQEHDGKLEALGPGDRGHAHGGRLSGRPGGRR